MYAWLHDWYTELFAMLFGKKIYTFPMADTLKKWV